MHDSNLGLLPICLWDSSHHAPFHNYHDIATIAEGAARLTANRSLGSRSFFFSRTFLSLACIHHLFHKKRLGDENDIDLSVFLGFCHKSSACLLVQMHCTPQQSNSLLLEGVFS